MIKKLLLFFISIIFTSITPMHQKLEITDWNSLPTELKFQAAYHLDTLKNYAAFSQTCKEHSQHISVDALLFNTNISHFLTCSDYTKALIHYAKQNFPLDESTLTIDTQSQNYKKISFLINTENEEHNFNRLNALNFFGYENSSVINTIKAYQAIPMKKENCDFLDLKNSLIKRHNEIFTIIIKNHPNLTREFNHFGQSILILAVLSTCYKEVLLTLLNYTKGLVNTKDTGGNTPLHYACLRSNYELAELLIEHHCDVKITNTCFDTALNLAIRKENKALVDLLIKKGADINIESESIKEAYSKLFL